MNCIRRQSKEFIDLLDKTGLQPSVLEAKIITYQDKNGINAWPSDSYFDNKLNVNFQKNQTVSDEGKIASEKTIRDLAARLSDRIGMPIEFESDRTKQYKGKIENNVAYVNLAYATLDTPIHEILGHPIIRAIKNKQGVFKIEEINDDYGLMTASGNKGKVYSVYNYINNSTTGALNTFDTKEEAEKYAKELEQNQKYQSQLYQNLLKELEYGRGKEVLDRIKRDYSYKGSVNGYGEYTSSRGFLPGVEGVGTYKAVVNGEQREFKNREEALKAITYTLEEQQEEAIVELLGLMTAEKLDNVKDGKLISLLKRLLKEMKQFVRSLLNQKEVEIDKLPDNMTLGDLSDLLAYSNSKLILPGYEVLYTTPDNQQFKTYQEASNHISQLAKSVEDVDLDNVNINNVYLDNESYEIPEGDAGFADPFEIMEYKTVNKNAIIDFIQKNKEYEQSKEIIEEWKKVNNIQYNPEEIYSRGQEFSSVVGAYSSFDVNLMMQNLLQHIEDNEKAGGQFAISAYTKPVDKQIGHLEGGGGKIKFKLYPKSKDILWASNIDVYSGSVWDASEKVNKDKKSELLGVSYTKYPSINNVNSVQPNLAAIVDDLAHHHNELGIALTGNNFRLEYDEDIPYQTKKIIDSINSILDQKYGKLIKPKISKINTIPDTFEYWQQDMNEDGGVDRFRINVFKKEDKWFVEVFDTYGTSESIREVDYNHVKLEFKEALASNSTLTRDKGIQPTQTKETLKEKINEIAFRVTDLYEEGDDSGGGKNWLAPMDSPGFKQKEYTEQALINTKIAKLKEVAKKYPRSLIRSEVKPINNNIQEIGFRYEDVFQKIPSTSIKPGVQELFDSNPELANEVYEALGFNKQIVDVPNKEIEFLLHSEKLKINLNEITLEEEGEIDLTVKNKWNTFAIKAQGKKLGYIQVLSKEDNTVKIGLSALYEGKEEVKQSIISKILDLINNIFKTKKVEISDKKINVNAGKGVGKLAYELLAVKLKREYQKDLLSDTTRSDYAENLWKSFEKQGKAEVIGKTDTQYRWDYYYKFNVNNQITPQQKQQALQLYSQYIDTGKQDIEGFKEFVGKPKGSTVFFQQLDMFKNVLTVAQREYIKERVKSTKMYKGVLTWNPKFNNFDVKNLLEKDASDFNRQLQKELKINFLPLKLEPKKITNFSKSNATYGGKRTQFYVAKLMATDGTFPQMDTVKELRLPDPKITDQMKSILSDLGINLVNWEAYSAWYEKQYGKPLLANAIADMTNKVIAMRESGEKIDTLPEEVSHFILYTMRDIPWVKNLLARVDETPEWQEHSENYTKYYNGDMDMVRLEVLGKILAKSFVSNGEGVSKKWYRYIEELWQRFLSLFGRDNIRRRMDYLAAEVVFNPSMKKKIAVNLNRFGITPYDNVVFANLDVEDFLDTDVLNKHAKIVEKSVDALADSLRRDLNSKAASVGTRQKLYEYMLQQINKGNHTISMAYLVSTVETESNSVLRRLLQFEDDFQKERSAADFNTFARILRHTNDFTLTYKDTFTELESALMIDDLRLKSQIKVFEDMEDLNSDEKILFKNLKERKALINEVLTSIGNSKKVMTMMEQNYQKYAKHIFMNVITPMLEERFAKGQYTEEQKEVVIENLKLQLDEAKDIDAINKWMQSMAESGDDVLGIADRLTKDTIEKAKMKSISVGKDLIDLASEYEAATGSRDTSFMYGKNDAGLLTGDYITEIDTAKYVTNKALFYDELNTRYKKLSEEAVDDDARKGLSAKKKKEIANWINANTEVLDEKLREQLKRRKKEAIYAYYISDPDSESQIKLAESKYQEWLSEREKYNVDSGYTKYGKEFIVPKKEVYPSKQYKQLNPAQKKFHTKYMLMYKSMKEYMPDHIYNSNTAIQIRKDGMERILSSENKFKEFTKLLEEGFTRKVDDTERGMTDEDLSSQEKLNKRLLKNSSGRRIYTVPIHHLMKLEDSSELSTDAVSAMLAFIDTSTRYEGISEIADSLEVFGDILKYRKMITTDTLNRSSVESEGGNAYARYMKYLEMVIYGKTKNDEGVIPGTTIDVAKLIDNINNYTAMNNLAFNMYAGVANVGLGNILMREEAFAKQYVKHEDLNFAFKEYSKQLPGILNEVGEVKSKNKLRLLLEYTDALQDHENKMRDLGWAKEKHQRIVNRSHMYFMNHMGEHQMQSRMMLALMHNVKLKDSEGKDITMYDAFEVVNNRIVIKDGITNLDGSKFSEKQIIPFNIRMKAINQRLHGIYNETDKSIIQQYALGRAAIMFRKWVVPGINRRFEKEYYNWSDMETREGFYRTSAKFLIGIIKETKDTKNLMEAYKNNLNQLTDAQKANMARAISELGYFFLLLTSGTALMMFAKGIDDDDWLLKHSANHLAHATLRIKSEMGFYVFPSDFLKLLKSPAASINTLEKILNITKFIDYSSFIDEEKTFLRRYQSGRYEDELYLSVWAKGMIPTWRTISDIAHSEDKLKFLTK